jgi:hypothetical protein
VSWTDVTFPLLQLLLVPKAPVALSPALVSKACRRITEVGSVVTGSLKLAAVVHAFVSKSAASLTPTDIGGLRKMLQASTTFLAKNTLLKLP